MGVGLTVNFINAESRNVRDRFNFHIRFYSLVKGGPPTLRNFPFEHHISTHPPSAAVPCDLFTP